MRRRNSSRGQALVEFCLAFPLVLVFLFAIVDIAYIGFKRITIQAAAADGARLAATFPRPSKAVVVARVKASAPGLHLRDEAVVIAYRRDSSKLPGVSGEAERLGYGLGGQTGNLQAPGLNLDGQLPAGGAEIAPLGEEGAGQPGPGGEQEQAPGNPGGPGDDAPPPGPSHGG